MHRPPLSLQAPQLKPFPKDFGGGYPQYTRPAYERQIVRRKGVSRDPRSLQQHLSNARQAVASAVAAMQLEGAKKFDTVVLDLPCTLFSLKTTE